MAFNGEAQVASFTIPDGYSPTGRRQLAEAIISKILERTESGIDKDGKAFDDLEPEYKAKKLLMGGAPIPNLRLTGEMQSDLEYKPSQSSRNTIVVGFRAGTESNAKARGHISGWENTNPKKKRDFLGLPENEVESLLEQYPPDESGSVESLIQGATILRDIIGRIGVNVGEI